MLLEYLRIGAGVMWSHRFRSFLTVLSITIGAFSIVLMSSLASSGQATLFRGLEEMGGARILFVTPKVPVRSEAKRASYTAGLTLADRDLLFGALPHIAGKGIFSTPGRRDVLGDSGVFTRTDLVVGDGGFLDLFGMRLARGRGFTEEENRSHAKVCVAGHKLVEKVWGDGAMDVRGRWLTVGKTRCQVIGQFVDQERWGINMGFDWRDLVLLPNETLADQDPMVAVESALLFKTTDARHNDIVKRILNALLVARHHGVDDFEIFDFSGFMGKFDAGFLIMRVIVGLLAGIALLVGGVGVMNMMLVSVSERVREIGVRRAIGASPGDIAAQFLCEAMVLSGAGGALGVFAGIGAAALSGVVIRSFKPMWVPVTAEGAVIAALGVSVGVGLLFGFFPARGAAKLDVVEALRR